MAETKWLGKYRAIVMDNNDPERRGRIRVQCPTVLGNYLSSWCEPCIPYATDYAGDYYVPPVNEAIWVEFEEGDVDKPIWNGGWYKIDSSPLKQGSNPEDYRYITFKNSVIRMGDKEFIFELRDGDSSYTVTIDTSTWLGLNYIGSKTEQELNDLETILANKTYLLETFPSEVQDEFDNVKTQITDVANNFNSFLSEAYNPFTSEVGEQLSSITEFLNTLSSKIGEIDGNLQDLQNQINSISNSITNLETRVGDLESRVSTNSNAYNLTMDSISASGSVEFTYYSMI